MKKAQQKQKLRKTLLKRRKSIPEEEYLLKSAQICEHLTELAEFKQAQTIHCYIPIHENREVNTQPLIKKMIAAGKKVIVPVAQIEKGTLRNIRLENFDGLKANRWGVLEPAGGSEVMHDALDLIIVPMVGGDRSKNRLGYGKGFYDRFLAQTHGIKIGLLFDECLVENVSVEIFDVQMDIIITEHQFI